LRPGETESDVVRDDELAGLTLPRPTRIDVSWAALSPTYFALCEAVGNASLELPYSIALTDVTRSKWKAGDIVTIASHHEGAWFWALSQDGRTKEPPVLGLDESLSPVGLVASSVSSLLDVWTRCLEEGGLRASFPGEAVWNWAKSTDPVVASSQAYWSNLFECSCA
jgi:hypothetical protein